MTLGKFDFGEWSTNELAREGRRPKRSRCLSSIRSLIRGLELDFMIGDLYRQRGEKDKAIAGYRLVLKKDPYNAQAKRVAKLGG